MICHDKVFSLFPKKKNPFSKQEASGAEDEKLLLSEVGHLTVLEVKLVHEGLTIEKVVEGFIPDLKKPGTQTEEASLQKWRNPACKKATANKSG